MSAPKGLGRWGLMAKLETTYATDAAPAAGTDGVALIARPDVDMDYVHKGERSGTAPGTNAALQRAPMTGRFGTLPMEMEAAGPGVAYSASKVPNIHLPLRACGMGATLVSTAGQEKYTYAPSGEEATPASLTLDAYARGERRKLTGAYGQFGVELAEKGGIPKWTFDMSGIMPALPVDLALPAITYADAHTVMPAKAEGLTLLIGTFNPVRVHTFSLKQERSIGQRGLDNTTGNHGGFQPGTERRFTLECLVEATALATVAPFHTANTLNPRALAELGTPLAISMAVGATQYRRWKVTAPAAQLLVADQDEDNVALWALTFELKPSTLNGVDELAIIFD